jgi:hypothetical protein
MGAGLPLHDDGSLRVRVQPVDTALKTRGPSGATITSCPSLETPTRRSPPRRGSRPTLADKARCCRRGRAPISATSSYCSIDPHSFEGVPHMQHASKLVARTAGAACFITHLHPTLLGVQRVLLNAARSVQLLTRTRFAQHALKAVEPSRLAECGCRQHRRRRQSASAVLSSMQIC